MAVYEIDLLIVNDNYLSVGDDVYRKPNPLVAPWSSDLHTAEPDTFDGNYLPTFTLAKAALDTTISYRVYRNVFRSSFTVDYGSDANRILSADVLAADLATRAYVAGDDLPSGLVAGRPYWMINVVEGVGFELEDTQGSGIPVDLGDSGSGVLTFTLASRRSQADELVATIQADASALIGEGQANRNYAIQQQIQSNVRDLRNAKVK